MIEAIVASFVIMSLSLLGAIIFGRKSEIRHIHIYVLPTAVGVFLGVVFFELIPETLEASRAWGPLVILIGFLSFYVLSHILETFHHHHAHESDPCVHNGAKMLLIGDAIHNIADGVVIASAFMVNPVVGMVTTVGIALHEIPQEIAEFSVLIQSGYTRNKAAVYNLLSASSIVIGVCITYVFAHSFTNYIFILTGIAAGNLLYIAGSDLLPELRHSHREHFKTTFIATLLGIALIGGLITYTHKIFGDEHEESTIQK